VLLKIDGMGCEACQLHVRTVIGARPPPPPLVNLSPPCLWRMLALLPLSRAMRWPFAWRWD
jgi:hypothetical protein